MSASWLLKIQYCCDMTLLFCFAALLLTPANASLKSEFHSCPYVYSPCTSRVLLLLIFSYFAPIVKQAPFFLVSRFQCCSSHPLNYVLSLPNSIPISLPIPFPIPSSSLMGGVPTVIGECGIPFNMHDGASFKTGDWSAQTEAMEDTVSSLEEQVANQKALPRCACSASISSLGFVRFSASRSLCAFNCDSTCSIVAPRSCFVTPTSMYDALCVPL